MRPPKSIQAIIRKYRRTGPRGLNERECCALVLWQLGQIAEWEAKVWDKIWGPGGGGTPPPPPAWPP